MLKRIFQLSAFLMVTLALNSAQAEIRDTDFTNGKCRTEMGWEVCLSHCRPQIATCMKTSGATALACCNKCVELSEGIRRLGDNQRKNYIYNRCLN